MTSTQEIVLNAVNAVVLRRQKTHRVPECALRSEIRDQLNAYSPTGHDMPSCRDTDDALQWLVNHGFLKATLAVNEMTYYVLPPANN
ncbi:MAG: hypothetical protein MJZ64_00415 [Paludibacteraceae bacterium]|nr:hypothetical protein [Paludibacteraceae bacterium]